MQETKEHKTIDIEFHADCVNMAFECIIVWFFAEFIHYINIYRIKYCYILRFNAYYGTLQN